MSLFANIFGDFGAAGMPGTFKRFFVDVVVNMARSVRVLTLPKRYDRFSMDRVVRIPAVIAGVDEGDDPAPLNEAGERPAGPPQRRLRRADVAPRRASLQEEEGEGAGGSDADDESEEPRAGAGAGDGAPEEHSRGVKCDEFCVDEFCVIVRQNQQNWGGLRSSNQNRSTFSSCSAPPSRV